MGCTAVGSAPGLPGHGRAVRARVWVRAAGLLCDVLVARGTHVVGLGANLPEDAIDPLNRGDADGDAWSGAHCGALSFPQGLDATRERLLVGDALR